MVPPARDFDVVRYIVEGFKRDQIGVFDECPEAFEGRCTREQWVAQIENGMAALAHLIERSMLPTQKIVGLLNIINTKLHQGEFDDRSRDSEPTHVNAYIVHRMYGGPEEGGWYYDAGEPIHSEAIPDEMKKGGPTIIEAWVETRATALRIRYGHLAGRSDRFKVNGGPDLIIVTEDHFAQAFPKERPRYE